MNGFVRASYRVSSDKFSNKQNPNSSYSFEIKGENEQEQLEPIDIQRLS